MPQKSFVNSNAQKTVRLLLESVGMLPRLLGSLERFFLGFRHWRLWVIAIEGCNWGEVCEWIEKSLTLAAMKILVRK